MKFGALGKFFTLSSQRPAQRFELGARVRAGHEAAHDAGPRGPCAADGGDVSRRYPANCVRRYAHRRRRVAQKGEAAPRKAALAGRLEYVSRSHVVRAESFSALRLLRRMYGDAKEFYSTPQVWIVFESGERQVDARNGAQERERRRAVQD